MSVNRIDKFYKTDEGKFLFRGAEYDSHRRRISLPFPTGVNIVQDMRPDIDDSQPQLVDLLMKESAPGTERLYDKISIDVAPGIHLTSNGQPVMLPYEIEMISGVPPTGNLNDIIKNFISSPGRPPVAAQTRQIVVSSNTPGVVISPKTPGDPMTIDSATVGNDAPTGFTDNNDGVLFNAGQSQIISLDAKSGISVSPNQITRAPAANIPEADLDRIIKNFIEHPGQEHVIGMKQIVNISGVSAMSFNPTSITFTTPANNVADPILEGIKRSTFRATNGLPQNNGQNEVIRINPHPGITTSTTSITFRQKAANKATKADYIDDFIAVNGKTQVIGVNQAVIIQPNSSDILVSPQIVSFPTQTPNIQPSELYKNVTMGPLKPGRPGTAGVKETGKDKYILQLDGNDVNIQGTTNKIELVKPLIGFGVEVKGQHAVHPANPSIMNTNIVITQQAIRKVDNTAEDAVVDKVMDLKLTASAAISQAGATGLVDPNDGSLHRTGVTVVHLDPTDEGHAYLDRANLKAYIVGHYQTKARLEKHPNEM